MNPRPLILCIEIINNKLTTVAEKQIERSFNNVSDFPTFMTKFAEYIIGNKVNNVEALILFKILAHCIKSESVDNQFTKAHLIVRMYEQRYNENNPPCFKFMQDSLSPVATYYGESEGDTPMLMLQDENGKFVSVSSSSFSTIQKWRKSKKRDDPLSMHYCVTNDSAPFCYDNPSTRQPFLGFKFSSLSNFIEWVVIIGQESSKRVELYRFGRNIIEQINNIKPVRSIEGIGELFSHKMGDEIHFRSQPSGSTEEPKIQRGTIVDYILLTKSYRVTTSRGHAQPVEVSIDQLVYDYASDSGNDGTSNNDSSDSESEGSTRDAADLLFYQGQVTELVGSMGSAHVIL